MDSNDIYPVIMNKAYEIIFDDNLSEDFKKGFCACFAFMVKLEIDYRKEKENDE